MAYLGQRPVRLPGLTDTSRRRALEPTERMQAERPADRKADVRAILVVFAVLVLGAIHFVSGWTF